MTIEAKFDKAAILADHAAGMSVEEIAAKHGCHRATVYATLKAKGRKAGNRSVDWAAVQAERNAGVKAIDLIKKYDVSSAAFYTKTHPAGGKPPVIRSRKFSTPTPSPFGETVRAKTAGKNGHHKLVDEIKTNLKNMLDSTVKERNEVVAELSVLDRMIARLEKATK